MKATRKMVKKVINKVVKKPASTTSPTLSPVLDLSNSKDRDIQKSPIEDVVRWRDTASLRVSKGDHRKKILVKELSAIERKTQADIRWIRKLNSVLNVRVFGQQKLNKGDRIKINISKEIVQV
jgi:hypothetical protein